MGFKLEVNLITYLKHMFIMMFINMMLLTYLSSSKLFTTT